MRVWHFNPESTKGKCGRPSLALRLKGDTLHSRQLSMWASGLQSLCRLAVGRGLGSGLMWKGSWHNQGGLELCYSTLRLWWPSHNTLRKPWCVDTLHGPPRSRMGSFACLSRWAPRRPLLWFQNLEKFFATATSTHLELLVQPFLCLAELLDINSLLGSHWPVH